MTTNISIISKIEIYINCNEKCKRENQTI